MAEGGMKRADVRKLLANRKRALKEGGGRLVYKRPPKPGRVWRTRAKNGPVTIIKPEPASDTR